jgi:transcriptional regulator of acetoin/glycerol metabolism
MIQLCCKFKNDDGTPNPMRKRLELFVRTACDRWRSEAQKKGESSSWKIIEKKGIEKKDENALLLAGEPKALLNALEGVSRMSACVAVLPDDCWNKDLSNLLQNPYANVLLVVRGNGDFNEEDILHFSEILKRLERTHFRASGQIGEEAQSKKIDWKCKISDSALSDSSFVSFFSDPAMIRMGQELKAALLDIDRHSQSDGKRKLKKVYSILLLGESGVGKTLAAEWIARQLFPKEWEYMKIRPDDESKKPPFISINVGTLPHNMVDVELFGATAGAYTSADKDRTGVLEDYKDKVVFFDEIGEMEPKSQVRLLKYLDNGEVRKVGSTEVKHVFSIVIAATNRPLDQWIRTEDSPFRADLFYRFDHVVKIPSLKERKTDMRLLISLLLQDPQINEHGTQSRPKIERISLDAIKYLENAAYPGNFRDLRVRIRSATAHAIDEGTSVLCLRHLTQT